eukprot:TRINITY_DN0_c1245_g1_i1.p1 TRINITY_DN0_c1245_g1~~TRINITY_DN0_c1245_g1_i1.p1  ORF type:complete len:455 (-),score=186.84 TRINITY_DN0_c1245_g1_i1:99-1463(-)
MRATGTIRNLWSKDEDCNDKYDKMDRGWFRRVHNHCKTSKDISNFRDGCDLKGYKLVLAYALACGIGWIIAAVVAILASLMVNKMIAFVAAGVFAVFYIIFIVLFGLVWHSVRKFNKECLNKTCKDVKKRGKKSSFEFLAYSICSFVLIFGAIICCVIGALGLDDEPSDGGDPQPVAKEEVVGSAGGNATGNAGTVNQMGEGPSSTNRPAKADEYEYEKQKEPKTEEKPKVSTAGQEYINKFHQLNKYIADKNKMAKYADKKFDQTDVDKSGTLVLSEFKAFVTKIMTSKGLPAPSDRKVASLMKRYDTDKSNTLEKGEFHNMLLEIFIESREILIAKYAVKKADSWKPAKVPAHKDTSRLAELDELLKNTENFYKTFEALAKSADKNKNAMLDIDEVTELLRTFCNRYRTPVLTKSEIVEIMNDMGRDIREYDPNDLRMVAYAVMSISRNLLK